MIGLFLTLLTFAGLAGTLGVWQASEDARRSLVRIRVNDGRRERQRSE